jgi:hypothetical protein
MSMAGAPAAHPLRPSSVQLIALAICSVLGIIAGAAFIWLSPTMARNIFLAGFLWTLLVEMGSGIGRCVYERVCKGEWRRALALGFEMTFPATTMYLAMVVLLTLGFAAKPVVTAGGEMAVTRPDILATAPILYAVTLVVALMLVIGSVLTSPFPRHRSR